MTPFGSRPPGEGSPAPRQICGATPRGPPRGCAPRRKARRREAAAQEPRQPLGLTGGTGGRRPKKNAVRPFGVPEKDGKREDPLKTKRISGFLLVSLEN